MARNILDVLTGKPQDLPYDIQTEQDELQKRMEIARLLESKGIQDPTKTPLTVGGKTNWAGIIGNLVMGLKGKSDVADIEGQRDDVARRYNEQLTKGMEDFYKTMSGTPAEPITSVPQVEGQAPQIMPAQKGDALKAVTDALKTGVRPLRDIAMEQYKAMLKAKGPGEVGTKDMLAHLHQWATPESIVEFVQKGMNDTSILKPQPKYQEVNKQLVKTSGGAQPTPSGDYRDRFGPTQAATATMPAGQFNVDTNRYEAFGSGQLKSPEARGNTLLDEMVKGRGKALSERADTASQMMKGIAQAQNLLPQIDQIFMGPAGNVVLGVNQLLNQVHLPSLPGTANAEQLKGAMGDVLLAQIRALAPVTEQDIKEVKDIIGSSRNTKEGMAKSLEYLSQKYSSHIDEYDQFVQQLGRQYGMQGAHELLVPRIKTGGGFTPGPVPAAPAGAGGWKIERGG